MGDSDSVVGRFLKLLPAERRESAADGLEPVLSAALAEAREAWPGLDVDLDALLSFLAQRLPEDAPVAAALQTMKTADLYLACGCAAGDPAAVRAFKDAFYPMLDRALPGVCAVSSQVDDIKQAAYQKIFVGDAGREPAIQKYDGVGELRAWVRVTAVRMALNLRRDRKRERPLSPQILVTVPQGEPGAEEEYFKRYYSDAFKQAFQQALQSLVHKQRNLLRYHYVDGLTVEQIGRIYRVNKSTISRRLADIRELLLTETRNSLVRQLDVGHTEFESIMRLIQSRMDVSISRFLKPE
ncbi:MAG: sigma-70 family RNA polymerase sigma factor [bacterium]